MTKMSPDYFLRSKKTEIEDQQVFNIRIPFEGYPITDQNESGRCWIFAATNVFRVALMKRHGLLAFELSQAYLFFYDKLEKANYFLESILDTASLDLDSRTVERLLMEPITDGGQWDMVYNLVDKYGLVPQTLYPDSANAISSVTMDRIINTKLRQDALELRHLATSGTTSVKEIRAKKERMMREIHLIVTLTLGPPPSPNAKFKWEYLDKDNVAQSLTATPISFARELSTPHALRLTSTAIHDMFSLINDPRNEYNTLLTVDRLCNMVGGKAVKFVNVAMPVLKEACVKMLQAGQPVFFCCDVAQYTFMGENKGIMDPSLIDYELGFNIKLKMSKAERVMTGESGITHAVILTGVHVENGKTVRWRVQNSWGPEAGENGFFVMTDKWVDEFGFQAVVEPRFVREEILNVLKTKPKVLPLWDAL